MKVPVKLVACALFLMIPCLSVAAEEKASSGSNSGSSMQGMQGMKHQGGMGMGMMGMMMNMSDEHFRDMQEDMLKMHDIINRINATKDPAEKKKLKEEHLQMMKAHHAKMMGHMQMMQQGSGMQGNMKMHHQSGQMQQ
ncbi:MAG: hypothetical protein ACU843_16475 [Gammaproteobacteria bacterium]